MKRISVLLIIVALVVGMVGCPTSPEPTPTVEYSLTISSSEGGSVITPGEATFTFEAGTVVDLIAQAEEGYRFRNWIGDVGTIADASAAQTTIVIDGDLTISSVFVAQYVLTIGSTVGGEVATPGEGTFSYDVGTVVQLAAEALEGYRFAGWTGDVGNVANIEADATAITMNDDYAVTASFVAQYTLTIASTDGGHIINPGDGTFTYDAGTVVDLVAEAWEGYKFLNWTGEVNTIGDVDATATTVSMEGNYTVTASFLEAHLYLDQIGPGLWHLFVFGEGVQATVTDEGVLVNIASDSVDDAETGEFMAAAGRGWEGDFDVRMGFELILWPERSGVRVGLSAGVSPSAWVNIERVGMGPDEWPYHPHYREVYLVNSYDRGIHALTLTGDLAGELRIRRRGEIVTGYYRTPEGWHELYRSRWPMENAGIRIAVWSDEYLFGWQEASVLMRIVEIVETAP